MAAVTTRQAPVLPSPSGRAGFGGTLRSEFTKIRSVRSTYWTLLVLLAVSIGIGAAICAGTAANWNQTSAADRATFDATQVSIAGLFYLGQLVIVVFGAIVLTAEYSTGMIRTSLTAMPRRVTVYAAKALVFAVVALVVTLVAAFVAFFLGQALLASTHANATLSEPNVLRAVIGSALYVTLCGLFAFAAGAIFRHTAATITTIIGLLFLYALPLAGAITGLVAVLALPPAAAGLAGGDGAAALALGAGLAGWALMSLSYLPMLRLYRLSPLRAPGLPLIALLYAAMTADSARRHYAGRGAEWRGRTNLR